MDGVGFGNVRWVPLSSALRSLSCWHTFFIQIFDLHWWDAKKNFKRTYQASSQVPASEATGGVINHHQEQNFRNKKKDKILLFSTWPMAFIILLFVYTPTFPTLNYKSLCCVPKMPLRNIKHTM